jgi:hypothetical protein
MKFKPDVSIFAAAIRPDCWMDYYNYVGENDISFEIIFVGPNTPKFKLPDNFRFIHSTTKPAQCFEIGRRAALGNLLINTGDDCVFATDHPLDKLYSIYSEQANEKLIVSCRYMQNGVDRSETDHYFFCTDHSSPVMPLCMFMSRKLYDIVGGVDRNFVGVFWDLDIAMRVYAVGGTVIMSNVYCNEDKSKKGDSDLCAKFGGPDRGFLEYLWVENGKVHFNRKIPFAPFFDYKLLEETQGPRGKW